MTRVASFTNVLAIITAVACGALLAAGSRSTNAATTSLLATVNHQSGDRFYNYDFTRNDLGASPYYVDWGMDILFWNVADVGKVKGVYTGAPAYLQQANDNSRMYALIDDGWGMEWDQDNGVKSPLCPTYQTTSPHMRIYANPGEDYNYNVNWGYYVIASTHRDWQECWSGTQYGWSEDMEDQFASWAYAAGYTGIADDWQSWSNNESEYWQGNHYWQTDGMATAIEIWP